MEKGRVNEQSLALLYIKMDAITKKEKYIAIGTLVKVKGASEGWGSVVAGDWGIVTGRKEPGHYTLFIERITGYWACRLEDVECICVGDIENIKELKKLFGFGGEEKEINRVAVDLLNVWRSSSKAREDAREEIGKRADEALQRWNALMVTYNSLTFLLNTPPPTFRDSYSYGRAVTMVSYLLKYFYKSISISHEGIIEAVTKDILIEYKGHLIKMGEYFVRIAGKGVTISAPTKQLRVEGFIHPHVGKGGSPCWGNWWTGDIGKHIAQADYLGALESIHKFLCHADPDGWYKNVMLWHPDRAKMCQYCWELGKMCKCNTRVCVYCGEDVEKGCKCIRCPQSGEIIGKEYDPYCRESCSSWDKKEEKCRGEMTQ